MAKNEGSKPANLTNLALSSVISQVAAWRIFRVKRSVETLVIPTNFWNRRHDAGSLVDERFPMISHREESRKTRVEVVTDSSYQIQMSKAVVVRH